MKKKNIFDISQKIIIITGSNGLLGKEYVKYFLSEDAVVIGLDKQNNLKSDNFFFYKCNLENHKSIELVCSKINKKFKKIDVLINNAAINENIKKTQGHNFLTSKNNDFNKFVDVNIKSILILSRNLYKSLKITNGSIINIGSIYSILAPDNNLYNSNNTTQNQKNINYTITKTAVLGLTKHLAAIFSKDSIRVNCVSLGGVLNGQSKKFIKKYSNKTLLKRMANKNDFNGLLHFLSSEASSYITGENIICDGGYSIT